MKEFYSKDLIEMVGPNLVHAQFGIKETIPGGHDAKIEWRKFSKFAKALTPLVEGVTPMPHSLSVDKIEKRLEQYGDYSILSDVLELTAIDPVVVEYTARHAENAQLTLDTIVRNDITVGTNVRYGGDATSRSELASGDNMTVALVKLAVTDLKRMNAPKFDGSYVAIIHPSVVHDLMNDTHWVDASLYAGSTQIFNGEVGKLYGVRFVESTEAKIWDKGSSDVDLTDTALVDGHKDQLSIGAEKEVAKDALVGKRITITTGDVVETLAIAGNAANAAAESPATGYTDVVVTFEKAPAVDMTESSTFAWEGNEAVKVYSTLFLGKGAYKVPSLEGGNMEVIVKSKGSAGTADPLNQRSTIGWKVTGYGAAIIIPEYILRVETTSSLEDEDDAN